MIGASQFSVQVSGNTVHASDGLLPMHNLPVVVVPVAQVAVADDIRQDRAWHARLHLQEREDPIVVALHWHGEPSYGNLRAMADGLARTPRIAARARGTHRLHHR